VQSHPHVYSSSQSMGLIHACTAAHLAWGSCIRVQQLTWQGLVHTCTAARLAGFAAVSRLTLTLPIWLLHSSFRSGRSCTTFCSPEKNLLTAVLSTLWGNSKIAVISSEKKLQTNYHACEEDGTVPLVPWHTQLQTAPFARDGLITARHLTRPLQRVRWHVPYLACPLGSISSAH
jgi:hypothetical protein